MRVLLPRKSCEGGGGEVGDNKGKEKRKIFRAWKLAHAEKEKKGEPSSQQGREGLLLRGQSLFRVRGVRLLGYVSSKEKAVTFFSKQHHDDDDDDDS